MASFSPFRRAVSVFAVLALAFQAFAPTAFAITVPQALDSLQSDDSSLPSGVTNPKGNIGFLLGSLFWKSTDVGYDVSKATKIKPEYLDGVGTWTQTAGGAYLTDLNGKVGIGTTSPTYALDVVRSGADAASNWAAFQVKTTATGGSGYGATFMLDSRSFTNGKFYTFQSTGPSDTAGVGKLQIHDGTSARFVIDSGNVGIGTTSPGAKLEVAGQVKITGGTPGVGKALISDATGLASWSASAPLYSYTETDPTWSAASSSYYTKTNLQTSGQAAVHWGNLTNVGIASAVATGALSPTDWSTFNAKAPIASPGFTGTPTAPTAAVATNTTQIATTAYVKSQGYVTAATETDPQVGAITTNYVPKWNGTALVTGTLFDNGTNVGIGTATPGAKLDVVWGAVRASGYLLSDAATDNLLVNGDFEMGNLSGWSGLDSAVAGAGVSWNYAAQRAGSNTVLSDDFIPVNPARDVLQLEGYFKKSVAGTTPGIIYFGYIAYDANRAQIITAPCGTYCYFGAAGAVLPADGAWHKFSATTTGEGTAYPNFPVGTKYVRVLVLINYSSSADSVTQMDHVTLKKINNGPIFAGNNFSTTNLLDQYQASKLYTTSGNSFIIEPPTGGNVGIGITNPLSKMTVYGTSTAAASSSNGIFKIDGTATNALVFGTLTGSPFAGYIQSGGSGVYPLSLNPNGGNVGIGTVSPAYALDVSGTVNATGLRMPTGAGAWKVLTSDAAGLASWSASAPVYTETDPQVGANTANYVPKWNGSALVAGGLYDNGTNLGVGTATPQSKFHVYNAAGGAAANETFRSQGKWTAVGDGSLIRFTNNHTSGTNPNAGEYNLAGIAGVDDNGSWGGALYFKVAPTGTAGGANLVDAMVLKSNGNVGIGTATPGYKLDVAGGINAAGNFTQTSAGTQISLNGWNGFLYSDASQTILSAVPASPIIFRTTNTERVRIDGSGNMGIGTSSPGANKLMVTGGDSVSATVKVNAPVYPMIDFFSDNADVNNRNWRVASVYNSYGTFQILNSAAPGGAPTTPRFNIDKDGNVGIGIVAPGAKLEVAGQVKITGGTPGAGKVLVSDATGLASWSASAPLYSYAETDPQVGANTANYVPKWNGTALVAGTIFDNGTVGIWNTSPLGKFHAGDTVTDYSALSFANAGWVFSSVWADHNQARSNVITLIRDGVSGLRYAGAARFDLSRWASDGVNARTQLDIALSDTDTSTLTDVLSLRSNGNVGIGTTTPGNKLQVQGGALTIGTPGSYAFAVGNSNANDVTIGSDASSAYIQSFNSKPLHLNNQGNNTIINQSPGRVLIGTNSDNGTDKLQVTGSAIVSGNLTVQGSVITDKLVNRTVNNVSISGSLLPDAAAPLVYRDIGSSAQRWNALYLSGQLVSGVATGTAPFAVTSTTVNTNLNADMVDGYHANAGVVANNIVVRDAGGYVNTNYFNSTDDVSAGTITYMMAKFGDNYYRSATAAKVQSFLGLGSMAYQNTASYQAALGYTPINKAGDTGIGALTVTAPLSFSQTNIQMRRDLWARSGISWYDSRPSWSTYMSQAGTVSTGPQGNLTAPSGSLVTGWALRDYIENAAGYGWTFESAANTTTPSVVAEIRASDGAARFGGNVAAASFTANSGPIYRSAAGAGYLNGNYAGVETTATSGAIYSIGGAYVPGTTTLWNMYGIGYGYSGGAGITATGTPAGRWGMYVASAGVSRIFMDSDNGNIYVNGSYNGAGTGLTGTAAGLSIGGSAWSVAWTGVSGKPTTMAGYGITDFVSSNSTSPVAADATTTNGHYYTNSNIALFGQADGSLNVQGYNSSWVTQIFQDYRTGQIALRGKNNGTWQAWRVGLDSSNYNTYSPTLTGGGASGSWGINITGNAATATSAVNSDTVDGYHASSFAQASSVSGTGGFLSKFNGANAYQDCTSWDGYGGCMSYVWVYTNSNAVKNSIVYDTGVNVGIGTVEPSAKLEVAGQIKITGGTPGFGRVLISDSSGLGTWGQVASANILDGAVASADITDATIVNADIAAVAAIAPSKIATDASNRFLTDAERTAWNAKLSSYTETDPEVGVNTTNYLSKWNGSALVSSTLFDNGTGVGVGTSAPVSPLTIDGTNLGANDSPITAYSSQSYDAFSVLPWSGTTYLGFGIYYKDGTWVHDSFNTNNSIIAVTPGTGAFWYTSNDSTASFNVASGAPLWNASGNWDGLIQSTRAGNSSITGGNFGIGIAAPTEKLDVVGNVKVSGNITATAFIYSSDRNLKKNIVGLTGSLKKITQLNGYSFDWKSDGRKDLWVIAQEVEKIYPELVATNSATGLKAVEYGNLVAPIIEAIKELSAKVDTLFQKYADQSAKIEEQEKRLEELEKKFQKLEKSVR